jgi:hypothetical protein
MHLGADGALVAIPGALAAIAATPVGIWARAGTKANRPAAAIAPQHNTIRQFMAFIRPCSNQFFYGH